MTGNKTVTVEFEAIPADRYQLTTSVINGHGTLTPASGPQEAGKTIPLTATPDAGYRIKQWTGTNDDGSKATTNAVTMTGNKTVTVEFEAIPADRYQLTTSVINGHGTLTPASGPQEAGKTIPLTATPDAGYRVKQWTGTNDDGSQATTNAVTITSNKTVTVEFEAIPADHYQLTTNVVNGHGTLTPTSGSQEAGKTIPLTATPDAGYRVKQWAGTNDDGSKATTNAVTMIGNKTVTVEFEAIPADRYQLTTNVINGHGTLTPASGSQEAGKTIPLTATPEAGYRVKQWTGTDGDSSKFDTNVVTMNGDMSVSVEFEAVSPDPNTEQGTPVRASGSCCASAAMPAILLVLLSSFMIRPHRQRLRS